MTNVIFYPELSYAVVGAAMEVYKAQAINYLAATGYKSALLINFGEKSLRTERIIRRNQNRKFV